MNYVVNNPTALVNHPNLTLSPLVSSDSKYEFSAFSLSDIADVFKGNKNSSSDSSNDSSNDSENNSSGILPYVLGTIGDIASVLPQLGIGSQSRINETQATADASTQVINAHLAAAKFKQEVAEEKHKDQKEIIVIGGTFILIIMVVLFTLKS
ncbi:hypothetical protein SAMN05444274_10696 [Mariniphaga anaerophila]|uniref:Uncharacterized protein n=1 Tax=Mariniphaga anaerophila TaxID=1484053 RepID=A0A1M5CG03_9BACT|nr:hypothetical protein [Mariniphaga anaerophila]SHF53352.1 hypothetical protein SAMN05444274_10696 [Mariniphaga anaerophila]